MVVAETIVLEVEFALVVLEIELALLVLVGDEVIAGLFELDDAIVELVDTVDEVEQ